MDFSEKIAELTKKVRNIGDTLGTEEATKNALVMPFIAALGYALRALESSARTMQAMR